MSESISTCVLQEATSVPNAAEIVLTQFPDTRESLLLQVKDPQDRAAWELFSGIYRPVIYRLARQRGFQHSDAEDLSQQVLMSVAAAIPRWQKAGETVRFRHWLKRVTRNAILNSLSRGPSDKGRGESSAVDMLRECPQVDKDVNEQLTTEFRRELYRRAAEIVKRDVNSATWSAFEMSVIDNQSIESVASELNKSIGTVYAARSRVMRRLNDAVRELEVGSEQDGSDREGNV